MIVGVPKAKGMKSKLAPVIQNIMSIVYFTFKLLEQFNIVRPKGNIPF